MCFIEACAASATNGRDIEPCVGEKQVLNTKVNKKQPTEVQTVNQET